MFSRLVRPIAVQGIQAGRAFSTSKQNNFKVVVVGASGGIGQPLSLLLKLNPYINELTLFDIAHTPGVTADLSHIDTVSRTSGFLGMEKLRDALVGADVVVVPAGVPRKPGMTRDDLFNMNASVAKDVALAVAEAAPEALLAYITNPVNSVVPIAYEAMKKKGKANPNKLFGITTLDLLRTSTFVAEELGIDPKDVDIPVIGGHAGKTIIPVFCQSNIPLKFEKDKAEKLVARIQEAGTEVVKAKAGAGSATLSMAYAGARFTNSLLRGLHGHPNIIECAFVKSDVAETPFWSNRLVLGTNGVQTNMGIGKITDFERDMIKAAVPELKKSIDKGIEYAQKYL